NSNAESLKALPAHGLSDAEPLMAGLALDEKRIKQCQIFEQRRAREGKWPTVIVPEQPIKLRAKPRNARPVELEAAIMKYNFNLGDNRRNGCFINAFQPNSDGTVTDYTTRLMWKSKASADVSRSDADRYVSTLNTKKYAGYSDWRLPTTEEMASLIDWHRYGATSYLDHNIFQMRSVKYMTADTYEYEGFKRVWTVNSSFRLIEITSSTDEPAHVQAVRSL
ncbi:MAG: DUF1566 domain-containing protein, partial [Candidatus Thiodiazotropha sp.]